MYRNGFALIFLSSKTPLACVYCTVTAILTKLEQILL